MAKKALMIIAHENFRDEEYTIPRMILEDNGIEVTTASLELGIATGKMGTQVSVDITLKEVDINKYNAIIYIGGAGCKQFWDDPVAHCIAKEAAANNKVLAAICSAPVTLARSGLLKDKRATCYPEDAKELKQEDVKYTGAPVEQDGLIITADGPDSAGIFGTRIVKTLEQVG